MIVVLFVLCILYAQEHTAIMNNQGANVSFYIICTEMSIVLKRCEI
jgi:hypothetical protein